MKGDYNVALLSPKNVKLAENILITMSTIELKNKLKEKIEELNEDALLEQLLGFIELESYKTDIFKIPTEHKAGIEEGLQQIKKGKTKSHKDVMAKYK